MIEIIFFPVFKISFNFISPVISCREIQYRELHRIIKNLNGLRFDK